MTNTEYLCRHFSRIRARLKIQEPRAWQSVKVRIDVGRDRSGEFFDIRCFEGVVPEILDVQPGSRHLVLMVREGEFKNKFLLGHDERHWFAAAVPGDNVHDVRTAIASLRPTEIEGRSAIRQGEWFFVSERGVHENGVAIQLISIDPKARSLSWRPMTRDADVYARGEVRHPDHKTIDLDGWRRVYMNRERFARHAPRIAFLD